MMIFARCKSAAERKSNSQEDMSAQSRTKHAYLNQLEESNNRIAMTAELSEQLIRLFVRFRKGKWECDYEPEGFLL